MEQKWTNIEFLESKENKRYKLLKKLNKKKYRDINNIFIAEGEKFIDEIENFSHCVIKKSNFEYFDTNYDLKRFKKITVLADNLFNELSTQENSQGIIFIHSKNTYNLNNIKGDIVILDDVQDPGNVGTIIRTLVALNYSNLILTNGSCDVYTPKAVRASMGSIFKLNIIYASYEEIINFLKENNYTSFATNLASDSIVYTDCKLKTNKNAYIFGNEGGGVSKALIDNSDYSVIIPISDKVNSLNVSVATAVFLYKMREIEKVSGF